MEPEVQEEASVVVAGPVNDSPKEVEQSSVEVVGIPPVESSPPPERKTSTEDPSAIIESLRARLLYERNSSKSARQQAQQLARKVKELEKGLAAEVQRRKDCESLIQELMSKLDKAGVKLDVAASEDQEQTSSRKVKPNWISVSRARSSSDSLEALNSNSNSTNGEQESSSPHSQSGSPVSDTSVVTRRVGRSCRTVRRKELGDVEIDKQVKGSWSKVGEDIVEMSKLRESETVGSESGWVSRMVDMLESKAGNGDDETQDGDRAESSVDTEVGSSNNNGEDNSYETLNTTHSDCSTFIPEIKKDQTNVASESIVEPASSVCASPSSMESSAQVAPDDTRELERDEERAHEHAERTDPTRQPSPATGSSKDDVEDILRALRLAKQQLRSSGGNYAGSYSPAHRSFADFQPRYESGASAGLVTRPLAQFIPASHEFRIQRSRSQHSYVDTRLSFANFSSPSRF